MPRSTLAPVRRAVFTIFAAHVAGAALAGAEARPVGSDVYRAACAACHGTDGRGQPAERVGFDEPLPDFTTCNFQTREPDADWFAVTHEGGPIRGFARMMPAFGGALSAPEIRAAVDHVRTFCPEDDWPPGEFNLPRALITEKAYPEDELVWTTAVAAEGAGEVSNRLVYEKRFGARNQFEIVLPFAWVEREPDPAEAGASSGWTEGVGDVAVGVKRALAFSAEDGWIVSTTAEFVLPTGDEDRGFGKGTTVFEPFFTWGQLLPGDAFVQAQAGAELPLESGFDDEAFARAVFGRSFVQGRFGRTWSPMIGVLGSRELVSGAPTHWDVLPQCQVTLNRRQHVMANLGVRVPVHETAGRDVQVIAYVLWDWFDGGLFAGW